MEMLLQLRRFAFQAVETDLLLTVDSFCLLTAGRFPAPRVAELKVVSAGDRTVSFPKDSVTASPFGRIIPPFAFPAPGIGLLTRIGSG